MKMDVFEQDRCPRAIRERKRAKKGAKREAKRDPRGTKNDTKMTSTFWFDFWIDFGARKLIGAGGAECAGPG